jgi:hypothetical protein
MFQKEISPLGKVTFLKIENKKLSKIYRKIGGLLISSNLNLESDITNLFDKLSDDSVDFVRDTFFEHMICEGYGKNLKEGYDILCDSHDVFIEIPLMVEAFKFYLLEQFKRAMKEGGALTGLKDIFPSTMQK